MHINVFIDTNILLNFLHFSRDELDALSRVFASHSVGNAKVYLTQQVCDEFKRNREAKIKDALKRFGEAKFSVQLPSFTKGYSEHAQILQLTQQLQQLSKNLQDKVLKDIAAQQLQADALIADIFKRTEIITTPKEIYERAVNRGKLGNPPGKKDSIGDAINWITLLEKVAAEEDIHIISEDGDFFSILDENAVSPFLVDEWKTKKKSNVRVYRTLSGFMKEHFNGIEFAFDKEKEGLIAQLYSVRSFASCHGVIASLAEFSYFSVDEIDRILAAAVVNDQFGWIVTDYDVSDFLNRVAVPKYLDIVEGDRLAILDKVIEEKKTRII
jgi:hypothetical protein